MRGGQRTRDGMTKRERRIARERARLRAQRTQVKVDAVADELLVHSLSRRRARGGAWWLL